MKPTTLAMPTGSDIYWVEQRRQTAPVINWLRSEVFLKVPGSPRRCLRASVKQSPPASPDSIGWTGNKERNKFNHNYQHLDALCVLSNIMSCLFLSLPRPPDILFYEFVNWTGKKLK